MKKGDFVIFNFPKNNKLAWAEEELRDFLFEYDGYKNVEVISTSGGYTSAYNKKYPVWGKFVRVFFYNNDNPKTRSGCSECVPIGWLKEKRKP